MALIDTFYHQSHSALLTCRHLGNMPLRIFLIAVPWSCRRCHAWMPTQAPAFSPIQSRFFVWVHHYQCKSQQSKKWKLLLRSPPTAESKLGRGLNSPPVRAVQLLASANVSFVTELFVYFSLIYAIIEGSYISAMGLHMQLINIYIDMCYYWPMLCCVLG